MRGHPRPQRRQARTEAGSATVLVLPLVGVLSVAVLAVALLGALVVGHRRVQAAADLAALAGAVAAQHGQDACAAAHRFAAHNGARLARCSTGTGRTAVEVALDVPHPLGPAVTVRARARAGPADAVGQAGGP